MVPLGQRFSFAFEFFKFSCATYALFCRGFLLSSPDFVIFSVSFLTKQIVKLFNRPSQRSPHDALVQISDLTVRKMRDRHPDRFLVIGS